MIIGSQISGLERVAAEIVKRRIDRPEIIESILRKDTDEALQEARETSKTVFLIGGPSQNLVTKKLIREGLVQGPQIEKGKILAVARGTNNQNSKIVVFSDVRGFRNIERESARLSPLAKIMPVAYVPAAASIIAIILAYLVSFIKKFLAAHITSLGKKRAQIKEEYLGFGIKHFHFKVREYIAILIGASVFGMAIALSYTGLQSAVLETFRLTLVVCLVIFALKESIRLLLSYVMKIHAEFKFWLPGAVISLIGGFLGNTLNTTAFVLEVKDKEFSFDKSAKIKYAVVLSVFIAGTVFFVLNFLFPSRLYQMIMASTTTLGMAEIIPVRPLQGQIIREWKPWLWFFTFIFMAILYVLMNFVV